MFPLYLNPTERHLKDIFFGKIYIEAGSQGQLIKVAPLSFFFGLLINKSISPTPLLTPLPMNSISKNAKCNTIIF